MANSMFSAKFRSLFRQERGNFAMIAAVLVPVVFATGSLLLDTTNAISLKTHLQNAADSAATATSAAAVEVDDMTEAEAEAFAIKFVNGQMLNYRPLFANLELTPLVTVSRQEVSGQEVWKVKVRLVGQQSTTPLAQFVGQDKISVDISSASQSARGLQGALSMTLVLDRSGSMGWSLGGVRKMTALKRAVADLTSQFDETDPDNRYVRVGVTTYSNKLRGAVKPDWNRENVREYVNKLRHGGGTDSTEAFRVALRHVNSAAELDAHKDRNGRDPKKFILFMTDGANNRTSADYRTLRLCAQAREEGVEVYAVAFAAPPQGRSLLSRCASSPEHYFDAKNSAALIEAFKEIGRRAADTVTRLTS